MTFCDPAVQTVFADYEARRADDEARMRALGAGGFAVRDEFLLPVGPEVGWFLHALIVARRPGRILELGTSYGYSTLFLADAARAVGARVVTMELAAYKQDYARQKLDEAGLTSHVEFRCGDAVSMLAEDSGAWDFVLIDIWKELYLPCFQAVHPHLSDEGVIAADNMIEPAMARPEVRAYRAAVRDKGDMQTALLPIGSGIELSVKWRKDSDRL